MITKITTEIPPAPKKTLADVVEQLQRAKTKRAIEQCSALRTLARVAGQPLDIVPADRRTVAELLNRCLPKRHGLSHPRWRNVKSLVLSGLDECLKPADWRSTPLSPKWQHLLGPLPEMPFRVALVPFARYGSGRGLEPDGVTEATFRAYERHLEESSSRSRPREIYLGVCPTWTLALERFPHWPDVRPSVDNRRNWYALPWLAFPASLKADAEAFLATATNADPLSGDARRPLRGATARARERAILGFASALVRRGRDPQTLHGLADLVETTAARDGLAFFIERMGVARTAYLRDFARLLIVIARYWVFRDPPLDDAERMAREACIGHLQAFHRRLKPQRTGMTDKNRKLLRHFEDDELVVRLIQLPERFWSQHPDPSHLKVPTLVRLQAALALSILISVPIRRKNLLEIKIGENLIEEGPERKRRVRLRFAADDVKNEAEIEFELPTTTVRLLDRYLQEVRPRLACAPSPHLFVGSRNVRKIEYIFSNQIADLTASELGVRITPHQLRHIAGFVYLKANPDGYEVVRRLLGHRSIQTRMDYYAGLETAAAHRHYDQLITSYREKRPRRARTQQNVKGAGRGT